MAHGCARVSRKDQNLDRQIDMLIMGYILDRYTKKR